MASGSTTARVMDPFAKARLGNTSVEVSRLGLGTAPLGGWPAAMPRTQGVETVRRAWAAGVRTFDTAPYYGHGLAEELLGAVLQQVPRDELVLSTKVGRLLVPGDPGEAFFQGIPHRVVRLDYSYDGAVRSLTESRERLGLDEIDVALIHDPDDHHREALEGAYRALAELRAAGVVRAIGVGMNWAEPLARFVEEADFDCMLCAGRYTLLEQGALDDLLPVASARGVSILVGGVYNSGLLARPGADATYDYAPAEPALIERARQLEAVCAEFDVPLRAAALQFPLAHPAVACILVGARTPEEVDDNLRMFRLEIPGGLWDELKRRGLVRDDAPTAP